MGSGRVMEAGSGSAALSCKAEAGEAHTGGAVRYDVGRMGQLLWVGLKE
jgi:hypothetical protein